MAFRVGHQINVRHGRSITKRNGGRSSPEYMAWNHMKQRCLNPRCDAYPKYGAIGITVCARWHSFDSFLADMGPRPPGTTLDRMDGSLGYFPGNCRWADGTQQIVNQKLRINNRSGLKGVSWDAKRNQWTVSVWRYKRRMVSTSRADFFEACCLVKSFEANEKAFDTGHIEGPINHTLGV